MPEQTAIPGQRDEFAPPKLFHVRIVRLGFSQLITGLITLALGVLDVSVSSVAFDVFSLAKVAAGIWVGFVIVCTGAVGVVTSRSELRRRTAITVFLVMSLISWCLSVVLIGIAIAEIAGAEFTEGRMTMWMEENNITNCLNFSATLYNSTGSHVRCIATTTFDQKLAIEILLIVFGYFEGLTAFYALLIAWQITRNYSGAETQNLGLREMGQVEVPGISVEAYFEHRMREDQTPEVSENKQGSAPDGEQPSTLHASPSQGEFPDSEQFRSHLEGLDGTYSEVT